jgi:hypothetical protein
LKKENEDKFDDKKTSAGTDNNQIKTPIQNSSFVELIPNKEKNLNTARTNLELTSGILMK